jgi:ribonuclease T2
MKRGDAVVISVSATLAIIVMAAVAYSQLVLDRKPVRPAAAQGDSDSSLLVLTWGPTLCQIEQSNPGCKSGHVQSMGSALVLHGLWPQPRTEELCGVSPSIAQRVRNVHSSDMPPVPLPPELEKEVSAMTSDATGMIPHEWYTHGTCSGATATEYFTLETQLAKQARAVLNPVFRQERGNRLPPSTVRENLDSAFGEGAGARAELTCRDDGSDGFVVYEIQLSLPPVADIQTTQQPLALGELLRRGPLVPAGCQDGRVPD